MFVSTSQVTALGWIVLAYHGQVGPLREPACSIRADGPCGLVSRGPQVTETRAVYVAARSAGSGDGEPTFQNATGASAAELENIEAVYRAILANQPIEQWRFETVRSRYLALLKRAGDDPAVEEAIRVKLARVTRHEQAAEAARTMQGILAESHRRDREVAQLKRRIAAAGRSRARAFSAVGFMQPSAQGVDGRKLYVLIANDGSTVAYLDLPPGLDPAPLVARRVGVRGVPHFNEDLGTRLITVRDVETIEARR
jgi:hypothetical protein